MANSFSQICPQCNYKVPYNYISSMKSLYRCKSCLSLLEVYTGPKNILIIFTLSFQLTLLLVVLTSSKIIQPIPLLFYTLALSFLSGFIPCSEMKKIGNPSVKNILSTYRMPLKVIALGFIINGLILAGVVYGTYLIGGKKLLDEIFK